MAEMLREEFNRKSSGDEAGSESGEMEMDYDSEEGELESMMMESGEEESAEEEDGSPKVVELG